MLYGTWCVGVLNGGRSDAFSLQLDTSYITPTLSSVQNTPVASSNSNGLLPQQNPGKIYDTV